MNKKIIPSLAVAAAMLAVLAPTASADHPGGDHPTLHREFDVNIPVPSTGFAAGPFANVCVDDDGDASNGQQCSPSELKVGLTGFMLASWTVIVDVVGKTAAQPESSGPHDCVTGNSNSGKKMTVSALGTGIQSAYVAIYDNTTGQLVKEHEQDQLLGNRVTLDVSLCSDPNA